MELLAPVGNLAGLIPALDQGADAVYVGLKDDTNARRFAGLNFTAEELARGAEICRERRRHLYVAINTFPQPGQESRWQRAVDVAVDAGVDAVIMADPGLLRYAAERHPDLERHLSVQASAANAPALNLMAKSFGVTRAVLPRVLDIRRIEAIAEQTELELEVFASGALCVMAEGRCHLSTLVTGQSPNVGGACSPGDQVRWTERDGTREIRLGDTLLDRVAPGQPGGYPTVCKGQYQVQGKAQHAIASPCSLSTLPLLRRFAQAGITALKLEGRQRSPRYSVEITQVWRQAIDAYRADPNRYRTDPRAQARLRALSEGQTLTTGPYLEQWQ